MIDVIGKKEIMKDIISKIIFFMGLKPGDSLSFSNPHLKRWGYGSFSNILSYNNLTPPFSAGVPINPTTMGFNPEMNSCEINNPVTLPVNLSKLSRCKFYAICSAHSSNSFIAFIYR